MNSILVLDMQLYMYMLCIGWYDAKIRYSLHMVRVSCRTYSTSCHDPLCLFYFCVDCVYGNHSLTKKIINSASTLFRGLQLLPSCNILYPLSSAPNNYFTIIFYIKCYYFILYQVLLFNFTESLIILVYIQYY